MHNVDVASDDGIKSNLQLGHSYFQIKEYSEAAQAYRESLKHMGPQDNRRSKLMKYLHVSHELS